MSRHGPTADEITLDERVIEALLSVDQTLREGAGTTEPPLKLTPEQREQFELGRMALQTWALARQDGGSLPPGIPERIGHYEILRVLGAGGFAVVYYAYDHFLNRPAAVKIPRPHALIDAALRARFLREAQATAQLEHAHIVATYDAGFDGDMPYIAYAYCEGPSLAVWIHEHGPLPEKLAAALVADLADAVEFSHGRGILHRDIKPGNVLLFPTNSVEEQAWPYMAKLSDFGLAKMIESDLEDTAASVMLGTPRYMAPEQTTATAQNVSPATDVYGLGMVLYEALTGQPPFTADSAWETLTQVRECTPAALRQLRPQLDQDLEVIALRCLAKDPSERFAHPCDLALELRRFLRGEPIHSRPVSLPRQVWGWCRTHRVVAGLITAVILSMLLSLVSMVAYVWRITQLDRELIAKNQQLQKSITDLDAAVISRQRSRELAEQSTRELRKTMYAMELSKAAEAWTRGDVTTMAALLQPFATVPAGEEDLREFGWHYLWTQQAITERFRKKLPAVQHSVTFSDDESLVAAAGADSIVRIWRVADGQLVQEYSTGQTEINCVRFGPGHAWIVTGGDDGTVVLWDWERQQKTARWNVLPETQIYSVEYRPASNQFLVAGNVSAVAVIDADSGQTVDHLKSGHATGVEFLALSPDGTRAVTCGADHTAVIWNLETRSVLARLGGFEHLVSGAAWSADSRWLAVIGVEGRLALWKATDGTLLVEARHVDPLQSITLTAEGLLIMGDRRGSVVTYQCDTGTDGLPDTVNSVSRWSLHDHRIYGLAATRRGSLIATASRDHQCAVFHSRWTPPVVQSPLLTKAAIPIHRGVAGPDASGRVFRVAEQGLLVQAAGSSPSAQVLEPDRTFVDVDLDGESLYASSDGRLFRWHLSPQLPPAESWALYDEDLVTHFSLISDDQLFVLRGVKEVALWNLSTRQPVAEWPEHHKFAVAPGRTRFILAENVGHRVSLYQYPSLERRWTADGHTEPIRAFLFDHSGHRVLSASADRTIKLWDVESGTMLHEFRGHLAPLAALALSPDGETLASADESGSLRLWDFRTYRELYELSRHKPSIRSMQFTNDGKELHAVDHFLVEWRWTSH